APDGSLFVADWGSRSYELHGRGAVWHIKRKDVKPAKRPADAKEALLSPDRKTRENAARALAKTEDGRKLLRAQLASKDMRVRATALESLSVANFVTDADLTDIARTDKEPGIRALAVRALVARDADLDDVLAVEQPASVLLETYRGWSFKRFEQVLPAALG